MTVLLGLLLVVGFAFLAVVAAIYAEWFEGRVGLPGDFVYAFFGFLSSAIILCLGFAKK